MPGTKAVVALTPKTRRELVSLSVKFEINSRNGLRRVIFELHKTPKGENVEWKIVFQLFEREKRSDEFTKLVALEIITELAKKAEKMAQEGMTPSQSAHAIGPAADDAKAAEAGEIPQEDADETVEATLKK